MKNFTFGRDSTKNLNYITHQYLASCEATRKLFVYLMDLDSGSGGALWNKNYVILIVGVLSLLLLAVLVFIVCRKIKKRSR